MFRLNRFRIALMQFGLVFLWALPLFANADPDGQGGRSTGAPAPAIFLLLTQAAILGYVFFRKRSK